MIQDRKEDINTNKNNLKELEVTLFFKSLFDIKYLDLFSKYYNNKQPLKEVIINDQAQRLNLFIIYWKKINYPKAVLLKLLKNFI